MDMEIGGPSWAGWRFARYGRAKDWRLHAPDGTTYCPEEIAELRRLWLDLDYWQVRARELEARTRATACYLSPAELELVTAALAVLQLALPRAARQARRWPPDLDRRPPVDRGDTRSTNRKKGDAAVAGGVGIVARGPSAAVDFAGGRPLPPKTPARDLHAGADGRIPKI